MATGSATRRRPVFARCPRRGGTSALRHAHRERARSAPGAPTASSSPTRRACIRVPAEGGTAVAIPIALDPTEQATFPTILPGGRTALVTIVTDAIEHTGSDRDRDEHPDRCRRSGERRAPHHRPRRRALRSTCDRGIWRSALARRCGRSPSTPRRSRHTAHRWRCRRIPAPRSAAVAQDGTLIYIAGTQATTEHASCGWIATAARKRWARRRCGTSTRACRPTAGGSRSTWADPIATSTSGTSGGGCSSGSPPTPAEDAVVRWSPDGTPSGVRQQPLWRAERLLAGVRTAAGRRSVSSRARTCSTRLSFSADGRLLVQEVLPGRGRGLSVLSLESPRRVVPLLRERHQRRAVARRALAGVRLAGVRPVRGLRDLVSRRARAVARVSPMAAGSPRGRMTAESSSTATSRVR